MISEIRMLDGGVIDFKKVYTAISNSEKFESAKNSYLIKLTSFDLAITIQSQDFYASAEEFAAGALFLHKETILTLSEQKFTIWFKSNLPEGTILMRYAVSRKPKVEFRPIVGKLTLEKPSVAYNSFIDMLEDLKIL